MLLHNGGKIYIAYLGIDRHKGNDCQYSFGCHCDDAGFNVKEFVRDLVQRQSSVRTCTEAKGKSTSTGKGND
jgi:hypothetical protein